MRCPSCGRDNPSDSNYCGACGEALLDASDGHPPAATGTTDRNSSVSASGVRIADDFRTNLVIDRYDPVFADMRASKVKHLRSANSEDAITWNVFRSLRQIDPTVWLPILWTEAFPALPTPSDLACTVSLWKSVAPPLGLLAAADEGASEIDVVIEAASWVWFIEAKFRSDISTGTTTRPDRDQVLRNLDVGTHYAGVRRFAFTLLVFTNQMSPMGLERVREYQDPDVVRARLARHRPDGLPNLHGVGCLTWGNMAIVLRRAAAGAPRADEKVFAGRAITWLQDRGISAD